MVMLLLAIDERVEILMITSYLEELQQLGEKNILGGKTPKEAAEEFVKTKTGWFGWQRCSNRRRERSRGSTTT
jgi:hypothetical protein